MMLQMTKTSYREFARIRTACFVGVGAGAVAVAVAGAVA
jgi:hypothetical protein